MNPINVAILGQGRSGYSIHGRHLLGDTERFRVVAVVDAMEERREKAERVFGCRTYADWRQVLDDDAVQLCINATFSADHPEVTVGCLAAGKHVLVDKPAAATPELLDEMVLAARQANRTLAIFQQSRFAPYFQKIHEVLTSGVLGRIVQISIAFDGYARRWDWQTMQRNVAGSLYNTGPHPLDQALDLLGGDEMPDIFCRMDRALTYGDAEDYVRLLLTLPQRPLVDLSISSCNAYPDGTYNIQGTQGGLWSSQQLVKWRWFDPQKAPEQRLILTPLTTPDGEPAYCTETLPWQEAQWESDSDEDSFTVAVARYYDDLYSHLTQGTPLAVTPAQVRRQLAVIRRCHELNPMQRME